MAITFVGAESDTTSSGSDLTVTMPTGTAEDDVVIAVNGTYAASNIDMAMTTSGYTELVDENNFIMNMGVFRKVQGATPDSNAVFTNNAGFNDGFIGILQVFRGVDTTTPEDATTTTATGTSATPDSPSITTVTDGAWVLSAVAVDERDTSVTAPSGYINSTDLASNNTFRDTTSAVASDEIATAGAEDPGSWSGFPNQEWIAATVALRPAASDPAFDQDSFRFRRDVDSFI